MSSTEDKVLKYVIRIGLRCSLFLCELVPETAIQKIIVALNGKGELITKIYGKRTFFVVIQSSTCMLPEEFAALGTEIKSIGVEKKPLAADAKDHYVFMVN